MNIVTVPLQRVFRVVNGGTPTADEANWAGDVQWATPVDLARSDGGLIGATDRTLTHAGLEQGSRSVPSGSLVVSTRAPIGYVGQTTCETAFNQGCRGLVPSFECDVRFFRYQLSSMTELLNSLGQGSTFVELSSGDLESAPVAVPTVAEQRAIADYLDAETARIDALIAKKRQLIHLLEERWRALVDHATSTGHRVRVRHLTSLRTSGPRGWAERVGDTGQPFIRSGNLTRDSIEIDRTELARVVPPNAAEARRSATASGDSLIGITGANTGWVAAVDSATDAGFVSQHVAILRPDRIEPRWLTYSLFAPRSQDQLLGGQYGGTKTQLGLQDLAELVVHVPTSSDQRVIVERLDAERLRRRRMIQALEIQVDLLIERRRAAVTAAVTGTQEAPR